MYLTIIAAVVIAFSCEGAAPTSPVSSTDIVVRVLSVLVVMMLSPVPGALLTSWMRRQDHDDPLRRAWVLRRVRTGLILCQVYLLAGFAFITFFIDWPTVVNYYLHLRHWVLVDEMLRLAPFIVMLVMTWVPLYRIDRMLRGSAWSLREYVEFHFRQYVLFLLAPFAVMVTVLDLFQFLPNAEALQQQNVDALIVLGLMGALFVFAPLLIRYVWRTRVLEEGPLRSTLTALCERARMGYRDLLVWETMGGHIVNAAVTGLLAPVRYVLVTDALTQTLSPGEIEAVFAHEIGHVKRHHMLFYALMTMGFIALFLIVDSLPYFRPPEDVEGLAELLTPGSGVMTAMMIFYWGGIFAFVSRRMEMEADLYAVELKGSTTEFVNALERISAYSGRSRAANSWRHFSVARRVDFLLRAETDPRIAGRFRTLMTALRLAILAFFAVSVAAGLFVVLGNPW